MTRDPAARMLVTHDGFEYDPTAPVLLIRTPEYRLTFDLRLACADPRFRSALSSAVTARLAAEPPIRVYKDFNAIKAFVELTAAITGSAVAVLTLGDFCAATAVMPNTYGVAKLVFGLRRMGGALGSAMDPSLRLELATIRVTDRNRRPGDARSPADRNGALSEADYADLAASLADRLAAGEIEPSEHALGVLAATLFLRPTQIARLKARDLVPVGWSDGRPCFKLRVPRIKQHGKATASSSKMRPLETDLGLLLAAQVERATLEVAADGIEPGNVPIFPGVVPASMLGAPFPELAGYVRHSTGANITNRIFDVLGVNSRCTRVTIATIMRAGNRSYRQIGLVLDNTPQAARAYVDDTPEVAARVELALGAVLAPLAALFLGRPGGRVPSLNPRDFRS